VFYKYLGIIGIIGLCFVGIICDNSCGTTGEAGGVASSGLLLPPSTSELCSDPCTSTTSILLNSCAIASRSLVFLYTSCGGSDDVIITNSDVKGIGSRFLLLTDFGHLSINSKSSW